MASWKGEPVVQKGCCGIETYPLLTSKLTVGLASFPLKPCLSAWPRGPAYGIEPLWRNRFALRVSWPEVTLRRACPRGWVLRLQIQGRREAGPPTCSVPTAPPALPRGPLLLLVWPISLGVGAPFPVNQGLVLEEAPGENGQSQLGMDAHPAHPQGLKATGDHLQQGDWGSSGCSWACGRVKGPLGKGLTSRRLS